MANTTSFDPHTGAVTDTVPSMADVASRVRDTASTLAGKAADLGHDAVDTIDARRGSAASGLESAAAGLHRNADKLPVNVGQYAHRAADTLGSTAEYVRDNRVQDAAADLEAYVKAHPTQALIGAAIVGFFAARMFTRD